MYPTLLEVSFGVAVIGKIGGHVRLLSPGRKKSNVMVNSVVAHATVVCGYRLLLAGSSVGRIHKVAIKPRDLTMLWAINQMR